MASTAAQCGLLIFGTWKVTRRLPSRPNRLVTPYRSRCQGLPSRDLAASSQLSDANRDTTDLLSQEGMRNFFGTLLGGSVPGKLTITAAWWLARKSSSRAFNEWSKFPPK
jgi:hypothetical protein